MTYFSESALLCTAMIGREQHTVYSKVFSGGLYASFCLIPSLCRGVAYQSATKQEVILTISLSANFKTFSKNSVPQNFSIYSIQLHNSKDADKLILISLQCCYYVLCFICICSLTPITHQTHMHIQSLTAILWYI